MKKFPTIRILLLIISGTLLLGNSEVRSQNKIKVKDLMEMSLEDLMNTMIVTASNVSENITEAPATAIVITRNDIIERGYSELTQIFDDLPGMDMIRVNGDISFKNYWRGFRNSFGAPYLFMLDGLPWRDLYYNDAEAMRAFPLSNIERVEIIYGPASSIYGANAFNGVINIMTGHDRAADGSTLTGQFSGGSHDKMIGDMNWFYKKDDMRISLTARFENGDAFPETNNEAEWSKNKYINDRRLWGGFTDSPSTAGTQSLDRHRAVDLRGFLKDLEVGLQFFELTSGYSIQYAADKVLPNVVWTKQDYSAYARYVKDITDNLKNTAVIRYNGSDVPNNSALAEGYNMTGNTGAVNRKINFELWQTLNSSWSFSEYFNFKPNNIYSLAAGVYYEQKNIQKAYEISSGIFLPPDSVFADKYPFPEPLSPTYKYQNRIITEDKSIYLNNRFALGKNSFLHFGLRHDNNSQYGDATTLRTGYIIHRNSIILKMLYGTGFQEPSPRVLYGAWAGLGSDPDLKPERSRSFEFSVQYHTEQINNLISAYYIKNTDTILNLNEGGRNVGERNIYGIDYHFNYHPDIPALQNWKFWGYYSYIHTEGDEIFNPDTNVYEKGEIGDIAPHKFHFGVFAPLNRYASVTLFGRYFSKRNTVATNPVKYVDGYGLVDLNLILKHPKIAGVSLSIKINNLFDTLYFQPGIRTADSGNVPGYFDQDNVWHGSAGWLNSLLPQNRRTFLLSLNFAY